MSVQGLDHVTVNTADLQRSREFYGEALGLTEGARPNFDFPGAWFYLGGRPVVHLIGGAGAEASGATGAFDHVAFEAGDYEAILARLEAKGLAVGRNEVPDFRVRQLFVHDPGGVKIELNFRG